MANKLPSNIQCRQYLDFEVALDGSSKDEFFFDCKDFQTPEDEIVVKSLEECKDFRTPEEEIVPKSPKDLFLEKDLTSEEEKRLLNKLESSLAVFENTPKLKPGLVRGNILVKKFSKAFCSEAKPISKPKTVPVPAVNLTRCKSIARLNKICVENQHKIRGFRKRSSSLNDLKTQKKQTYPLTPMCLKRTIVKGKTKLLKTTEERELEEIAKLQNQLKQHLRFNEMTLKRLNLKPKSSALKNVFAKTRNSKINKGLNSRICEKESRRNIRKVKAADLLEEVKKFDALVKSQPGGRKITCKDQKQVDARKSKFPSASSAVSEMKEKIKTPVIKTVPKKKLGFHSGLVFNDIRNKMSSDTQERQINCPKRDLKMGVQLLNFGEKSGMNNKENLPKIKTCSTVKKTKMQNSNCDFVKQVKKNKEIFDNIVKNPIKGLPLFETLARNK